MKKLSEIGIVESLMLVIVNIEKVSDQLEPEKIVTARFCVDELAAILGVEDELMEALHDTEPDFNPIGRYEELKKRILLAAKIDGLNKDIDGRIVFFFDQTLPENKGVLELLKADKEIMKIAKFYTKP